MVSGLGPRLPPRALPTAGGTLAVHPPACVLFTSIDIGTRPCVGSKPHVIMPRGEERGSPESAAGAEGGDTSSPAEMGGSCPCIFRAEAGAFGGDASRLLPPLAARENGRMSASWSNVLATAESRYTIAVWQALRPVVPLAKKKIMSKRGVRA